MTRRRPGQVRDAIVHVLERSPRGAAVGEVCEQVSVLIGDEVPSSSVRSYLRLNTPELFARTESPRAVTSIQPLRRHLDRPRRPPPTFSP
jgi:site-specific DNA-methyltransferase (adenine-specific)